MYFWSFLEYCETLRMFWIFEYKMRLVFSVNNSVFTLHHNITQIIIHPMPSLLQRTYARTVNRENVRDMYWAFV